jgi:hypothetical protein
MQMTIGGHKMRFLKDLGDEIAYLKLNTAGRPIGGVRIMKKDAFKNILPPPGLAYKKEYQKDKMTVIVWKQKGVE